MTQGMAPLVVRELGYDHLQRPTGHTGVFEPYAVERRSRLGLSVSQS